MDEKDSPRREKKALEGPSLYHASRNSKSEAKEDREVEVGEGRGGSTIVDALGAVSAIASQGPQQVHTLSILFFSSKYKVRMRASSKEEKIIERKKGGRAYG